MMGFTNMDNSDFSNDDDELAELLRPNKNEQHNDMMPDAAKPANVNTGLGEKNSGALCAHKAGRLLKAYRRNEVTPMANTVTQTV